MNIVTINYSNAFLIHLKIYSFDGIPTKILIYITFNRRVVSIKLRSLLVSASTEIINNLR